MEIGTHPKPGIGSLGDKLGTRPGYRGEQPVEATLSCHEFDFPGALASNKLIMSLGDAQDFVYRLDPFASNPMFSEHRHEHFAQSGCEAAGL